MTARKPEEETTPLAAVPDQVQPIQDPQAAALEAISKLPKLVITVMPDGNFDIRSNMPPYAWKGLLYEVYQKIMVKGEA